MRRLVLGLTLALIASALGGCSSPACRECRGGGAFQKHAYGKYNGAHGQGLVARHGHGGGHGAGHGGDGVLPGGGAHYRPQTEPAGGPVGSYAYPYYTLRGPRDYFQSNPPSIGPY